MMLELGRSNVEVFAETVLELAKHDRDVLVVTSDSRGSGKLTAFAKELPQQLVEVGIAEQNLVGIAAGLASCGKKVFAVSPACFLTARALEQIKNDIAYSDRPLTLVGISAGVSYGALGTTHHSLHDFAALRAIHNLDILVPADNMETCAAVLAAVNSPRPLYLRLGKKAMPHLYSENDQLTIGRAQTLIQGDDLAFIAIGETVAPAVEAALELRKEGIRARVISMRAIKPLDEKAIVEAARACPAVITIEEHSICGGLGEACAAVILQSGLHPAFRIIGLPDEEIVSGAQPDIFRHYGISRAGLCSCALDVLKQNG
jgi:transketolase